MSIVTSLKKALGFDDALDYDDEDYSVDDQETFEDEVSENVIMPRKFKIRKRELALEESTALDSRDDGFTVNIIKPKGFDEAMAMVDELKADRMLVLNTGSLDIKNAQRLIDFISGASYALSGDIQEVIEGIYVVSPKGISMKNSNKADSALKSLFGFR